ncbi:MAG: hypothetical protein IKP00_01430 [Victivallales bacterium]|nr:hypothetical protein [Victivallales bacterium]
MEETQSKKSLADRILKASALVGLAHICLKFAGLIQAKVATQYLDSSIYEPIMVVAFTGVINSLFLIGEEVIGPTFLTIFMKEKEQKDEKAAWEYTNITLSFQSLLLLLVCATITCFPEFYIRLFTTWTLENNPDEYKLLRVSLQFMAPSLFFLSIGSTTYVLLNGYKKFFLAAFGDASTKICIIIGLLIGFGIFGLDYHVLLFSIVVGSVAKVATHLAGMLSKLKYLRPAFNWKNPAFKSMLILMIPLLLGIIFAKVRDNFNNIYILTHIEQKGVLMANDLGRKLFSSIQWLVPYALQIALFPFLCELVSKQDREKLGEILGSSCRLLLSVFVPGAIILSVLAMPISIMFFMGGKTGIEIASWAGISTACYCLVLPAAAIECVLMQGSFADQRTIAVTVIGISTSMISVLLSYIFIIILQVQPKQAIMVVALGFVLSRFIKSFILALYMRRNIPMFPIKETTVFLFKLFILALIVGAITYGVSCAWAKILPDGIAKALDSITPDTPSNFKPDLSRLRIALRIVVSGAAGLVTFFAASFLLQLKEPRQMLEWTIAKVKHK